MSIKSFQQDKKLLVLTRASHIITNNFLRLNEALCVWRKCEAL